jgi:hypothetical protein
VHGGVECAYVAIAMRPIMQLHQLMLRVADAAAYSGRNGKSINDAIAAG